MTTYHLQVTISYSLGWLHNHPLYTDLLMVGTGNGI